MKKKATILLTDDEPVLLQLITEILTDEDYEIDTAIDGREALEKITSVNYDLILLDIHMSYMSGFEVYERLVELELPMALRTIVFLTSEGNYEKKHVIDFLIKHQVPCITKPFDIQEFKHEVNQILIERKVIES